LYLVFDDIGGRDDDIVAQAIVKVRRGRARRESNKMADPPGRIAARCSSDDSSIPRIINAANGRAPTGIIFMYSIKPRISAFRK
jgi:hypothetical protein